MEPCRNTSSKFSGKPSNSGRTSIPSCEWLMFCRPSSFDRISSAPFPRDCGPKDPCIVSSAKRSDLDACEQEDNATDDQDEGGMDSLWVKIQEEVRTDVASEPMLWGYYQDSISSHDSLDKALGNHLSVRLSDSNLPRLTLRDIFAAVLADDPEIMKAVKCDLRAVRAGDAACISYVHCLMNLRGFLVCHSHRIAHRLCSQGRQVIALLIQNWGVLLVHATGLVVGDTAVVGDNVLILHSGTLGGIWKVSSDRHPKIWNWDPIGAGICILGNNRIGDGAKISAGSVVLKDVPPRATAVGNPTKLVGGDKKPTKLAEMPCPALPWTTDQLYPSGPIMSHGRASSFLGLVFRIVSFCLVCLREN